MGVKILHTLSISNLVTYFKQFQMRTLEDTRKKCCVMPLIDPSRSIGKTDMFLEKFMHAFERRNLVIKLFKFCRTKVTNRVGQDKGRMILSILNKKLNRLNNRISLLTQIIFSDSSFNSLITSFAKSVWFFRSYISYYIKEPAHTLTKSLFNRLIQFW